MIKGQTVYVLLYRHACQTQWQLYGVFADIETLEKERDSLINRVKGLAFNYFKELIH